MRIDPRQLRRRGFTMIELVIVLVILSLAAGLAAPSLKGFGANAKLRDSTQQLVSCTRWARAEAAGRAITMRLALDSTANTYVVERQDDTGQWIHADGEFGTATALPTGFTLQLLSGGSATDAGSIDFYPDLRVTPASVQIKTPTGDTQTITCDYPAGQFAVPAANGVAR